MANYTNLKDLFTGIANAIRAKTGDTKTIVADDFPAAIEAIKTGGGDDAVVDALINRTISECSDDTVQSVGNCAFYSCSKLTSVNFPQAKTIGISAFQSCSKLTFVSFPQLSLIAEGAFRSCRSLTSVSFPQVTTINGYAFESCHSLTTVNFPLATNTGQYAFRYCSSLTSVSFPKVTNVVRYAFESCRSLTSVSFPKATIIGSSAFRYCSNLTSIYLGNSVVCNLAASDAFSRTSITSTTGSIFVPASLLASYQTATNWTYFSNRIYSYEF